MASFFSSSIFSFIIIFYLVETTHASGLLFDENFYVRGSFHLQQPCPEALTIIRNKVRSAVAKDRRMGASLLRLHFHDCFVNGCDGSVLLDDTVDMKGEKNAFPNTNSLRGFEVIDDIKKELEDKCPGIVSCADILAVAARDSVDALRYPWGLQFGLPSWNVKLGRKDSKTASFNAANTNLPSPFLDIAALISAFNKKGFTPQELVILSGGHTIGQARCTTFRSRIYNETNNINSYFAAKLKQTCPKSGGDNNLSPLDQNPFSPVDFFDNNYFKNLVAKKGLLHSDQQLLNESKQKKEFNSTAISRVRFWKILERP